MRALLVALTAALCFPVAADHGTAKGAVGVERLSPAAGEPGDRAQVTLACGFCFPPCKGGPGRGDGPCMVGDGWRRPPGSFPVSLVPAALAPDPRECRGVPGCPPTHPGPPVLAAPPRRAPFTLLGAAVPPAGIEAIRESGRGYVPRYTLEFALPARPPGVYAVVIFCDVCWPGEPGALISLPGVRGWRLRIESPIAAFRPLEDWLGGLLRNGSRAPDTRG